MKSPKKIALVTGGSRGIGRAIAVRLAQDGVVVGVQFASNEGAARQVVSEIADAGGHAFSVQADLGSANDVKRLAQQFQTEVEKRMGCPRWDILVNNAATAHMNSIEAVTEAEYDKHFSINVKGPYFLTQHLLPTINDHARIINISSGTSTHPQPQYSVYSMTKGAVNNLTLTLAKQLGPRGITVNTVAPGVTQTDMTSSWLHGEAEQQIVAMTTLGRIGMPEDIADVVGFLASDASRWVTGQYIEASGGLPLL